MQLHQHLRSLQTHGSLRHRRFRSAEHQLQTPVIEDTFQAQGCARLLTQVLLGIYQRVSVMDSLRPIVSGFTTMALPG